MGKKSKNPRKINKKTKDGEIGERRQRSLHATGIPDTRLIAQKKEEALQGLEDLDPIHIAVLRSPDTWLQERYTAFQDYIDWKLAYVKLDFGCTETKRDNKILRRFTESQEEPPLIRALAWWALAVNLLFRDMILRHCFADVSDYTRYALDACDSATDDEKRAIIFTRDGRQTVGQVLEGVRFLITTDWNHASVVNSCDDGRDKTDTVLRLQQQQKDLEPFTRLNAIRLAQSRFPNSWFRHIRLIFDQVQGMVASDHFYDCVDCEDLVPPPVEHTVMLAEQKQKALQVLEAMDTVNLAMARYPDTWFQGRFVAMCEYIECLANVQVECDESDINILRRFAESKEEPALIRALASFTFALKLYKVNVNLERVTNVNLEHVSDFHRRALDACDKASEDEKQKQLMANDGSQKHVRALLAEVRDMVASDHSFDWLDCGDLPPHLLDRIKPGGDKCDCCGKTREELGMTLLNFCSRCGLANYCSETCCARAWESGHKEACRKEGEIKVGDMMMINDEGLFSPLNLDLVEILQSHDSSPDCEVRFVRLGTGLVLTLPKASLYHIRPSK